MSRIKQFNLLAGITLLLFLLSSIPFFSQEQTPARPPNQVPSSKPASPKTGRDESADRTMVKSGTKINAQLESTLDAKTAKPGDEIRARVTKNVKEKGRVVVHEGDYLVGHVTQVNAAANSKASSQVGVTFDHLVHGRSTTSLNTVVDAVLTTPRERQQQASQEEMMEPMSGPPMVASGGVISSGQSSTGASRGGGLLGGVNSTANSTMTTTGSALGGVNSTLQGTTRASSSAVGGVGRAVNLGSNTTAGNSTNLALETPMRSIRLGTSTQASQDTGLGSTLSAKHGNLRMDSGTQLRFRVTTSSEAKNSKK